MFKIVSTIGPLSEKNHILKKIIKRSDLIRLNGAHNSFSWHKKVINKNYYLSIAQSSKDIEDASILVLPGQGAANSCVEKLSSDFPDLKKHILNKPFLGICLGFQILFEK